MPELSPAIAIKRFLEAEPNGQTTSAGELGQLKAASTPEEWAQFARDAAAALGVGLKS